MNTIDRSLLPLMLDALPSHLFTIDVKHRSKPVGRALVIPFIFISNTLLCSPSNASTFISSLNDSQFGSVPSKSSGSED
ncbi:hypothetical protein BLOT_001114 [Blomia tropicalis]|nr:hypothetical protein BLOT_001114 [Blomia tropicalis]